jgi:hypothetical protein
LANHRIYQYTSIGRSLDPAYPTNKAVLILMPVAAVLGAFLAWSQGDTGLMILQRALGLALVLFGSWALARELDPDDNTAAFISMAAAIVAAVVVEPPGILIVFVTLGLVRIVNRSTGMPARVTDSLLLTALSIGMMYLLHSPFFGAVAALAFFLDGSLKEPLRRQWLYGLVCLGGSVVYTVDHGFSFSRVTAPDTLFEWISLLFLIIFALDALLLKRVRSHGDTNRKTLDVARVRGGMAVGLLAAAQGVREPDSVVIIVATIAGLCIGMAFRKGFKVPT